MRVLTVASSYINITDLVYPQSIEGNITIQNLNISASNKRFTISSLPYFTSSSTSTLKKIASNLSQAINATVSFSVTSCSIKTLTYTSNSKDNSYNVKNQPGYTCGGNPTQVTVTLYDIEPASGSNEIVIVYNSACYDVASGGLLGFVAFSSNLGVLFSMILLVLFMGILFNYFTISPVTKLPEMREKPFVELGSINFNFKEMNYSIVIILITGTLIVIATAMLVTLRTGCS